MTATNRIQTEDEIIAFIITYIIDNSSLENIDVNAQSNFITEHLLDSFATLSMIMTLESEYSIKFAPDELGNKEMRIIGELAKIILAKLSHKV